MRALNGLLTAAMLLFPTPALSSTIYNNTILSGASAGLTSSQRLILIDDVLVPSSRNPFNLPLAINSITVNLGGMPGQSGSFSVYLFPVNSDGAPAPNPMLLDTEFVTFISSPFQLVTFGNSASTLFVVDPNFTAQPGFGLFYIGLGEDNPFPAVSWYWANGPDANLPTAYLDNLTAGQIFLNTSPGPPFPANLSYYMIIDGAPVPEPASVVLFGSAMLVFSILHHRGRSSPRPPTRAS